jgi:hypothetical protein
MWSQEDMDSAQADDSFKDMPSGRYSQYLSRWKKQRLLV